MVGTARERNLDKTIVSTVFATATHALIPLFWLFCTAYIMPRYYSQIPSLVEDVSGKIGVLFPFSVFMVKHCFVYLFLVALMLAADGAVHYSLLRASKAMAARLWSLWNSDCGNRY